jgi:hypothetical protein
MSSESEEYASGSSDADYVAIPEGPYTVPGLMAEVQRLQTENADLRSRALLGAASLPPETFYALTGFKSAAAARE